MALKQQQFVIFSDSVGWLGGSSAGFALAHAWGFTELGALLGRTVCGGNGLAHLPEYSWWLLAGHLCSPWGLRCSGKLDGFSGLREAFQESESRSCKASSGLALGAAQDYFSLAQNKVKAHHKASSKSSRERDPTSWCEEWQSHTAQEP